MKGFWDTYSEFQGRTRLTEPFNVKITNPRKSSAVLTVSLPEPMNVGGWGMTWGKWNPEFMCRIDPASDAGGDIAKLQQRLEPDLVEDDEWVTFLTPGLGTNQSDPLAPDTVIDALASGFAPPEQVASLMSKDRDNLALVYGPGEQVDPAVTIGPYRTSSGENVWRSRTDYGNLTRPTAFALPPQQINGERGGGWWPPKPTIKVSFMPKIKAGTGRGWRLYPYVINPTGSGTKVAGNEWNMAVLKEDVRKLGWVVDEGDLEGTRTHSYTGTNATYGWRCAVKMAWYGENWHETDGGNYPPFVHGYARSASTHNGVGARCPDGRVNAWEATVPNGVYVVTASSAGGCAFENVAASGGKNDQTWTYSVEVADGKFTLSGGRCHSVSWVKLDLLAPRFSPNRGSPPRRRSGGRPNSTPTSPILASCE